MAKELQVRLLDMLDQSYAAAEEDAAFDGFREAAAALMDDLRSEDLHEGVDGALGRHVERIARMARTRLQSGPEADAFAVLDVGPQSLVPVNAAAQQLFATANPELIDKSERHDLDAVARGQKPSAVVRLYDPRGDGTITGIARRLPQGGVRISLANIAWTPALIAEVGGVMDLTGRELTILEGLVSGLTQSQIAARDDRSVETVKAQCKTILRKSGCRNMAEAIQLAHALGYLHVADASAVEPPAPEDTVLIGGRRVAWRRYGALRGMPVILHHAHIRGPYLTGAFSFALAKAGITVYAPSRPGYGNSDPAPDGADYHETAARDVVALVDHLQLGSGITLMAFHGGSIAACHAQRALGARATGLLLVAGQLPIHFKDQDARLHPSLRIARRALNNLPQVLVLLARLSFARHRGADGAARYYRELLAECPADVAALDDPEMLNLLVQGGQHAQGLATASMIADAQANASDWSDLFADVSCEVRMILGSMDSVTKPDLVRRWATRRSNLPIDIVEGAGALILMTHWQAILPVLLDMCRTGRATLDLHG
ncbi:alpha/beta fold hydrolase [Roseobacter sp. HKCCA0434]|uniref:alpha/beta fold hydrolase n=1 Tax=Roseobacter sp. HKCCA0434 TaxID=3079297 RepID=UPI002905D339|nr:alpha/beta fold hydrolase [Roseobacter sp. HKCCA0434]